MHRARSPFSVALCLIIVACGDGTGPPVADNEWRAASIVSGNGFSCALGEDGSAYCWGANGAGQVGQDTLSNAEPIGLVAGGLRFTALAAGDANVCGLAGGAAYCWGRGQMLGTTLPLMLPTPVPPYSSSFTAITVGGRHACAMTAGGTTSCWGENSVLGGGQVGDGTVDPRPGETLVAGGHSFDEVSAGFLHSCGRVGTEIWCWGSNYDNALGVDGSASALEPQLVALGLAAQRVHVGAGFSCIESAASIHCWGTNRTGQLGDASADPASTTATTIATTVALSGVRMAAANRVSTHACALDAAGAAHCWGANDRGQLGRDVSDTCDVGSTPTPCGRAPGPVATALTFDAIAPGAVHTCAISDGAIYCWGSGERGEFGNGPAANSTVPVSVPVPE